MVGVSFAEIFYGNCLALGIPCATASSHQISVLQDAVDADPALNWQLDLSGLTFSTGAVSEPIQVAAGALDMLRSGQWDATGQLVARDAELTRTMENLPYLQGF